MRAKSLNVLMGGMLLGRLTQANGRLSLTYAQSWLARGDRSLPLSLSMPTSASVHMGEVVVNFLWNLLPDNEATLAGWAKRFQVSPRNPFALLTYCGEDCSGAVQFIRDERMNCLGGEDAVQVVDEAEIERLLAGLRADSSSGGRGVGGIGQFSLAGAQPKTALWRRDGTWGIPSGRVPTTHILKPPTLTLPGHAENEHLCLSVVAGFGLRAARTEVMRFGKEVAIVVERFDRVLRGDRILRLHQEDMCQALGVHPVAKYESDGGPSLTRMANSVLRWTDNPIGDRAALMKSVAFNFVVGGTDAHSKNLSIQIAPGGRTRMAPLYDVASILPYDHNPRKIRMACKVGGRYNFSEIMPRHWEREAKACGVSPDETMATLRDMIARSPDAFADERRKAAASGLDHPSLYVLVTRIAERCAKLAETYGIEVKPTLSSDGDLPGPTP